jgi:hypothetical protein
MGRFWGRLRKEYAEDLRTAGCAYIGMYMGRHGDLEHIGDMGLLLRWNEVVNTIISSPCSIEQ